MYSFISVCLSKWFGVILVIIEISGLTSISINWNEDNSRTTISSLVISFILVNNGVPILPPKNVLYPLLLRAKSMMVVVVVFPSEPVTPITLDGVNFITSCTSVVT